MAADHFQESDAAKVYERVYNKVFLSADRKVKAGPLRPKWQSRKIHWSYSRTWNLVR